ncbi:MAG: endonuclease/exonuclease/phosphatase family protein [Clostridia bacterium]|nr:endonuclease/exonuclease/phosphatase family protein [Deltaproteobacteria bacterium]
MLAATVVDPALVFRDAASCAEALVAGDRLVRYGGQVRIVSWNIRWFPDGHPGKTPKPGGGTNVTWLACALSWLDADVVVLEEIKRVPHALKATDALLAELTRLTSATWSIVVDDCPDPSRQHIAFLARADRVRLSGVRTRGEIDPTFLSNGTPSCPGRLRPGLSAYVKSLRGKADFHLVGVHLDSGKNRRDYDDRNAALDVLGPLRKTLREIAADDDVLVMGDFNTMGCSECSVSAAEERTALPRVLGPLGYRVASAGLACTEYYKDHGSTLDHVLVSTTMKEAAGASVKVSGVCAALDCKPLDATWLPSLADLSDHCPVVIDFADKDLD